MLYTKDGFCRANFGISYEQVLLSIKNKNYMKFEIPKKNGKRIIHFLPKESEFGNYQRRLTVNYLAKQPLPICVKGFVKKESYRNYLIPHVENRFFIRIDIHDFFGSINEYHIEDTFGSLLPIITTDKDLIISIFKEYLLLDGILPQGAVSSPIVSNIVFAHIDQRILKYCQILNVIYSRYADDMLFSSKTFDFNEKKWFMKKIRYILSQKKFRINYSKTKIATREISLNGFVISDTISLSRKKLFDIRHLISFTNKNLKLIRDGSIDQFLLMVNSLELNDRNLHSHGFQNIYQFTQYLCGYRAFLISWVDTSDYSTNQKEMAKLITKIENILIVLRS